ncbi:IS1634 family transposase [Gordonia rhizosphera]|uniref:Putative transposase n=1 Tax=Gordonia rhizosphera NBRC 16068 TaxID=1108045 RepID=K6WQN4_9ACTN|nr:IS1634 family transposase [Gordonia rhizosphera]GAB88829.1 putative transposase [Gordonia rhizosphera NBRC 16068]
MYLRETRRKNKDGSTVSYLQLAHNERHPSTGASTAKVIHNFGRAETVDRDGLARLVSSISRFLAPEQVAAAGAGEGVEILDSRRLGGAWTLDRLWERLGIGAAITRAAADRRLDAAAVERVIFTLVAQRALEPGSKLAATGWLAERVAISGITTLTDDQAYRGMDFLLEALDEIAAEVFTSVAHLLNLDLDIVFVDTTSTYFETDSPDELPEMADPVVDDGITRPAESGTRTFGHSKDFRTDLPQVVIAMAVTRDGIPVRCWTFPGNTADTAIIRTIKDDLAGWQLRRLVWVADRGFASATNRAYLTRGGGHYIHAEKLRHTNTEAAAALARPGRYHTVGDNLRVKEVHVAPGGDGDGDGGARAVRFVLCHNPDQAERDATVRANLVEHLREQITGSDAWTTRRRDEFVGSLKAKPGLRRYLRRTKSGLLRIDAAAIKTEAGLDGKWLLRTSDTTLTPEDLAAAYKQLLAVERGWRDMKGALKLRPVFHYREDRIRAHVQLCWLALLLIRVAETATGDTWRTIAHELDRLHLITLATDHGTVAQRSALTAGHRRILGALELPEPPRFVDFTLTA